MAPFLVLESDMKMILTDYMDPNYREPTFDEKLKQGASMTDGLAGSAKLSDCGHGSNKGFREIHGTTRDEGNEREY